MLKNSNLINLANVTGSQMLSFAWHKILTYSRSCLCCQNHQHYYVKMLTRYFISSYNM